MNAGTKFKTRCQNTGITRDASCFSSSRLSRNFALRGTGLVYSHCRKIAWYFFIVALLETRCPHTSRWNRNFRFERSQMLFSDDPAQITLLKNIRGSITLKSLSSRIFIFSSQGKTQSVSENAISPPSTVQVHHLYCRAVLWSYSVSIYRFKRDNFLSENVIFESKTCIQNGQYFERRLDLT